MNITQHLYYIQIMKIILVLSGQHPQSETIDDTNYSRMLWDPLRYWPLLSIAVQKCESSCFIIHCWFQIDWVFLVNVRKCMHLRNKISFFWVALGYEHAVGQVIKSEGHYSRFDHVPTACSYPMRLKKWYFISYIWTYFWYNWVSITFLKLT